MIQLAGTGLVVTPAMAISGLNPNPDAAAVAAVPAAGATAQVEAMAAAALDAAFGASSAAGAAPDATAGDATLAATPSSPTAAVGTTQAESTQATDPKQVGGADSPTTTILIHNMYDKDEEEDEGWPEEIKEEFMDECGKYGKIMSVLVMSNDPGGKIYATFETVDGAMACAEALAGRFFDKRQLRAEFIQAESIPKSA
mmetsp:Transcript_36994/g.81036  ORF Transcript_36994/g.81036 Transcript_36994/m.81036 type:complete len:199 (-) Transcript_36994:79-675(-)